MAGSIRTFVTDWLTDGLTRPILEDTECVQKVQKELLFLNPARVPRKFMTVPCPYLSESEDTFSFTMFGEKFELYCSEMLQNPFPWVFPDFIQQFSEIPDFPWLGLNSIWFPLIFKFVWTLSVILS